VLKTLRIRNLATIEDLRVDLGAGLNVITGETGAGKSIVVEARGLACGDRADSSLIRAGAERAVIEAAFDAPPGAPLSALGLDAADGDIVIRREIASGGAGRVLVNGSPATVAALRGVGDALAELHGQHEQRGLLAPDRHLELLDAYAGNDDALASVAAAHQAAALAEDRLARLSGLAADALERERSLRATVREIREVAPKSGEAGALRREREILQNGARMAGLLDEAMERLGEGDDDTVARIHAAERRVAELARIDPSLADLAARTASVRLELQDLRDSLRTYRDDRDFDPRRLETIEARRAAIERLLLKWGPAEDDALRAASEAEAELATLADLDGETAAARAVLERARASYLASARTLAARRRAAGERLGGAVERELRPLELPKARFHVVLEPRADGVLHPLGTERAEFHLAANPGEPARPLAKAASGGELSRVMLALHVVLDAAADRRVLVFDEVDAGVSGATALAVGARLAALAARHQVLCVTHLPQVAAHAEGHYHVSKRVAGGRTHTGIVALEGDARVAELARMLGGREAGSAARENAAELLAEAGRTVRARGRR
jgi:DNA repair protein RecN (Recombination protein N)